MRARRIASVAAIALASVCLLVALIAGYARTTVLDSGQFADRATSTLNDPAVRDLIAREITDQAVLRANRDLVAVRPLVQTAAGAIVGTPAFQSLFRKAVRDLHETVFTDKRSTATLTIVDVGVLLSSALEHLDPKLARELPGDFTATLTGGSTVLDALDAADVADAVEGLAWLFGIAAVVALALAVAVAPQRRRAIVHAGAGVAVAGAVLVIAYQIGRAEVLHRFAMPADQAAAGGIWDAFLQDLRTWALVTLGIGTVVSAAAASLLRPVDVRGPLRRGWEVATTVPRTPWRRALRAVALMAAGVLIIAQRQWVLDVALVLVGVYVLYLGIEELLRMLVVTDRPAAATADGDARSTVRRAAPWIAGGVASLLIVGLLAALLGSGGTTTASAGPIRTCDGHPQLCDRPLNDVAMAATHNAMSSQTYPGWLFAQQERDLRGQLDDGVRALLIDAHYGRQVGDRVLTDLEGRQEREAAIAELGEAGFAAAKDIRDNLLGGNQPRGERTTWLCHGFCEVGAIRLVEGLREVRDFVVGHPDEVVVIVVQDEGPSPSAIAEAVKESGLEAYVWRGRPPRGDAPWPTLREMIESGGRVVMMVENARPDPAVPWLHNAYDLVQETPYHFTAASQFSCAPNRGPADAPLFLLNHWIDTSPAPRPSNAAKVNAYEPLLQRARACQRERGRLPNLVAVDFYRTGDVMRVVDTLNGIPPS